MVGGAASGHTAIVTASGGLYTCGRNDSAGGGGHGRGLHSSTFQLTLSRMRYIIHPKHPLNTPYITP